MRKNTLIIIHLSNHSTLSHIIFNATFVNDTETLIRGGVLILWNRGAYVNGFSFRRGGNWNTGRLLTKWHSKESAY